MKCGLLLMGLRLCMVFGHGFAMRIELDESSSVHCFRKIGWDPFLLGVSLVTGIAKFG